VVDLPAIYTGKRERIEGSLCLVMWEGFPDAVLTGREELGFPKLFADIPKIHYEPAARAAAGTVAWLGHRFLDIELQQLTPVDGDTSLPGSGGPAMYYKYLPRTGYGGRCGEDVAYVTTSLPPPETAGDASPIQLGDCQFKKWSAQGRIRWHRATFEQLPTTFHIINTLAEIEVIDYVRAEMVEFSGPGIGISAGGIRSVEPA
jgi:Acetoacetate decarboxylase (ADC)